MRKHRYIALTALFALVVSACNSAASPSPSTPPAATTAPAPSSSASAEPSASAAAASPTALAPDPAEAVITGVEPNAEISFWTFYLSPTFDQYIKDTIARFEATYPGVKVKWEDHQATFQADLNNAFNAGIAPDVINLSVSEGWVSDYAGKGQLLGLNSTVPKPVQDIYFPGLWNEQLINGENFQFPWYQGLNVELINKAIMEKAGVAVDAFPKTIDGLPALCATILEKAAAQCAIRLTVTDLLAQMVYEGNVKVFTDDGKAFAFNSPEGAAWLQMYVDMNKAGTLDTTVLTGDDRIGLNAFSAGAAPFYATGPNLARQVKDTNATLYSNLAMVPSPLGKSGVLGKGLMSISVNKATKFPNASIALAQFFTNPRSMVQFAKQVAVYPSSPSAYDDPYFSDVPTAVEDSARPLAEGIISTYQDIVPTIPKKADVNEIVLKAVEQALFNKVPAQQALTDAVAAANKLIQ
jgi:putative chitobiose transport system substrate-binding protein